MGYHVYKKNSTPSIGDELQGFVEPRNKLDKYATASAKGKYILYSTQVSEEPCSL